MLLHRDGPGRTSWRKLEIGVEDPNDDLTDRRLRLDWEGDGTVIEVYSDAARTQRIYSGHTWEIGGIDEITEIYIEGVGAGSTELFLSLDPIESDPFEGERPISDLVVVNVNA